LVFLLGSWNKNVETKEQSFIKDIQYLRKDLTEKRRGTAAIEGIKRKKSCGAR
jgi:hypothetical protein